MISISNADRDKVVEDLREYASLLQERGMRTTTEYNKRRMALNLANKLERKPTLSVESTPNKKRQQPEK